MASTTPTSSSAASSPPDASPDSSTNAGSNQNVPWTDTLIPNGRPIFSDSNIGLQPHEGAGADAAWGRRPPRPPLDYSCPVRGSYAELGCNSGAGIRPGERPASART